MKWDGRQETHLQTVSYSTLGRLRSTVSKTFPVACQTFMKDTKETECRAGSRRALLPRGTTEDDVVVDGRWTLSVS